MVKTVDVVVGGIPVKIVYAHYILHVGLTNYVLCDNYIVANVGSRFSGSRNRRSCSKFKTITYTTTKGYCKNYKGNILHEFPQEFVGKLTPEQCQKVITNIFTDRGGVEILRSISEEPEQPNDPQSSGLPWCVCAKCCLMPLAIENLCCKRVPCITTTEAFQTNVLNADILSIAIVSRSDVYADDPEYSPASYHKASYQQWIMWQHGFFGSEQSACSAVLCGVGC